MRRFSTGPLLFMLRGLVRLMRLTILILDLTLSLLIIFLGRLLSRMLLDGLADRDRLWLILALMLIIKSDLFVMRNGWRARKLSKEWPVLRNARVYCDRWPCVVAC